MSKILITSYEDFKEKVINSDIPVLVDFFADWCGPCKRLAPMMEEMAENADGYNVFKVNVEELPELAEEYGVSSIPTIIAFKDGKDIERHVGLADKKTLIGLLGV